LLVAGDERGGHEAEQLAVLAAEQALGKLDVAPNARCQPFSGERRSTIGPPATLPPIKRPDLLEHTHAGLELATADAVLAIAVPLVEDKPRPFTALDYQKTHGSGAGPTMVEHHAEEVVW
jgi:hypothetical protein